MHDSVAAAASESHDAHQVPFFALYQDQGSSSFNPDGFQGLQLVHRVQGREGASYLATYWLSRDHWVAQDQHFRKAAQAEPLVLDGFTHSLEMKPKPLWKRLHLHTWVLALAAFLGALDAIGNHYEWLFARPSVFLALDDSKGPNVDRRRFATTLRISNQTRLEQRDLDVLALLVPRGGGLPVRLMASPATVSVLSPGSSAEVELSGRSPEAASQYDLHVTVTGEAGVIAPEREIPLVRPVRVWPTKPKVDWELRPEGAAFARIDGVLSLGSEAPHGVDCLLYIHRRSQGKPILDFFDATQKEHSPDNYTPGQERDLFSWHGPVKPFDEKRFTCLVPVTQGDDLDLLKTLIKVECYKAQEG